MADYEAQERQRTGISSLKVRYNKVFGYYIEISKANLGAAPSDYFRKQTLVNAERFFTEELKTFETQVLEADEKRLELEQRLFEELRRTVGGHSKRIQAMAEHGRRTGLPRRAGRGCGPERLLPSAHQPGRRHRRFAMADTR